MCAWAVAARLDRNPESFMQMKVHRIAGSCVNRVQAVARQKCAFVPNALIALRFLNDDDVDDDDDDDVRVGFNFVRVWLDNLSSTYEFNE